MSGADPLPLFARKSAIATAIVLGMLLFLWLLWYLAEAWLLLFAGLIFAIFLRALTRIVLTHLRLPPPLAYALVVVAVLAFVVVLLILSISTFGEGFLMLMHQLPEDLRRLTERLSGYGWGERVLQEINEIDWTAITEGTLSQVAGFFSTAVGALATFIIVAVAGIYLGADPKGYLQAALALVPPRSRPRAAEIMQALRRALEWWLIGRVIAMVLIGLLTWFGLLALGVPLAATLAFLAGALSFIPNIGPFLSAVPALLIVAAKPLMILYVAILYLLIHFFEAYVVGPVIQRRTIELPPATVLAMQIAFTLLYGFLGLLLAGPLTVALMVFIKTIYVQDLLDEPARLP